MILRRILWDDGDQGGGGPGSLLGQPPGNPPTGPAWLNTLPQELRGEASLATVPDVATLAKNYVNAQKIIGQPKVAQPQANWTDQQWDEWYAKIGRPEQPDAYPTPQIELAPGVELSQERIAEAKKMFHKAGLTPKQAEQVLGYYLGTVNTQATESQKAQEQERLKAELTLKQELGDKYNSTLDTAKAVVRQFGDEQFMQFIESTGMGNHPAFIKVLAKIGGSIMEDRAGGRGPGLPVSDATSALAEIGQLKTDKEFMSALTNRSNPGHKAAVDRWTALHQAAHPGRAGE